MTFRSNKFDNLGQQALIVIKLIDLNLRVQVFVTNL